MIKLERIGNHTLNMPSQATASSAGFDLSSVEHMIIKSGESKVVGTGFKWEISEGCAGFIWPRSGIAVRSGIQVMAGLIDSDYRGEIKVCLLNSGVEDFKILPGDRIAQLVISPVINLQTFEDSLSKTERGSGGFGSTGR